jgi:hypothetical protein
MFKQFRTILLPYKLPAANPLAGQAGSGMGAGQMKENKEER